MRLPSRPWFLLTASILATAASAADLTWEAAIQEVAMRNAELRSAQATLASNEELVRAARSGFFPQVSAGVSYSEVEGSAVSTTSTTTVSGYNASVSATQNLFAGFQDSARIEQAEANREAAAAGLAIVRARLSFDLKVAYAGLLYAQENVDLTAQITRRLEENVRLVELRFEAGRENKGSLLLTRANLAQARYEHLQAQQAMLAAQSQLARALGRAVAGDLRVASAPPVVDPDGIPEFEQLLPAVPDYRLLVAQEKAAAAGVRLARAGLYPSVNLSGSLTRDGADWFPEDDRRTVTASVSVPLFSGGRDYYTTRSSAEVLTASSASKENSERLTRLRLRQTYNAWVEAAEKLKVDAAFVEAAETRATIARSKYNNGLMTFEDWDRIETDLILRYKVALLGRRDRVTAEAAWEQTQGKGVIP
jgi:outer membrane protein TolC